MAKCQVLKDQEAVWAWQPFGIADDPRETFTLLGSHYRGFPVIKVSDSAKARIQAGEEIHFVYNKRVYTVRGDGVYEVTFGA
jgi:hypothetical protein